MDDLSGKLQELLSDPESMQQISELAAMLQGGSEPQGDTAAPSVPAASGGELFDPALLMKLSELFRTQNQPDNNAALLLALKPHLGAQRQLRVDKAVRLLRLYRIWKTAKASGMLENLL